MSQYFVKCGETKVNRRLSSPLAGVSLCIKIPGLQVPNRTKDGVETKKDYLVSKGSRLSLSLGGNRSTGYLNTY